MTRPLLRLVLALVLLLPASAGWAQVLFPQTPLELVGADGQHHAFTVELATTSQQLSQGLMFRTKMDADAGMLFDFGEIKPVSMWMKNTVLPLDMLFIDAQGRVTGIAQRTIPYSTTVISSPGPVKAVLELNGGTASRLHLAVGDKVVHRLFQ